MSTWQPWSLRQLVGDLRAGRTSAADAIERSRARIMATEPLIDAWVAYADEPPAPSTGPLGGAPLGIKDIIDVAGYPTMCGSVLRADAAAAVRHAPVVDAWLGAGATPVGKTVTTEFAYFAPGPTKNPAALGHTPGGSSSGSAAAVASGQVPLALGSQTAGSVTRPASYCGVASLVMAHGRYPVDGVVGLSRSCDSHGVFAAGASDLALAWSALTGSEDVGEAGGPPPRLLVWTAASLGLVTSEMTLALTTAAGRLTQAGAVVDTFPWEDVIARATAAHPVVMAYEAARERALELAQADRLSAPLAALLRSGAKIPDADYAAALDVVAEARGRVAEVLSSYDAILGPGAPGAAPEGLGATGDPALSRAWQVLGLPTVGVPGLRNDDGLPLGLQAIASAETDALRVACWIEKHL